MIKVVLHKIIYWSIILITILRASSLFSQVPVISIPQPAEIGRFDNFRQTSPQKPSGISSSRDAWIFPQLPVQNVFKVPVKRYLKCLKAKRR